VELVTGREDYRRGDDGFAPYRHLALHVLALALRDLSNPAASRTDRESARRFLTGSPMLMHWCRVAAIEPGPLTRHAAGPIAG
jgi:hypothetical protein